MARRSFSPEKLERLRALPLDEALLVLELYVAHDRDFMPVKDSRTQRWVVTVQGRLVELLVTGQKWFDARAGRGGGGAIDLAMHLLQVDFVQAIRRLDRCVVAADHMRPAQDGVGER